MILLIDLRGLAKCDMVKELLLFQADDWDRVWGKPHESTDSSYQQGTIQAGSLCIMVCSVFKSYVLDPLIHLNPSLSDNYLHTFMDSTYLDNKMLFLQDKALYHPLPRIGLRNILKTSNE